MITLAICWKAVFITLVTILAIVAFIVLIIAAIDAASDGELWGEIVLGIFIFVLVIIVFGAIYCSVAMEICH